VFLTEFRAVGIVVRNVEVTSGDVILNFDEDSFPKSKQSSASLRSDEVRTSATAASSAKKPHKEHQLVAALAKYSSSFPEKVSWLNVTCLGSFFALTCNYLFPKDFKCVL